MLKVTKFYDMKKNILICAVFIIIFLTGCCGNKYKYDNHEECSFYTNSSGYDYIRIPLIRPYEAICIDLEDRRWSINFKNGPLYYPAIYDVQKLAVIDSVILVYTDNTSRPVENQEPLLWFVIDLRKNQELGFSEQVKFNEYLMEMNIHKVKWLYVNDVYHQYVSSNCLPWISACN
jgi:hypothetical protein